MYVVGIAGGTGSGKTTLAESICRRLGPGQAILIAQDSYYLDRSHLTPEERKRVNYDHPEAFDTALLVEHLRRLKAGETVQVPRYDFTTHTRLPETVTVAPAPVCVVEGIMVLVHEELRSLLDLKVFVDTDADVRCLRRIVRDIEERGRTLKEVCEQYLSTVKPMHDAFVEPSKKYADIIVLEGGYNRIVLDLITSRWRNSSQV